MNSETLMTIVASVSGVEKEKICGKERYRKYVVPRYVFAYVMRKKYGYTFLAIGKALNVHHSTVIYMIDKVESLIGINDEWIMPVYIGVMDAIAKVSKEPIRVILTFDNNAEVNEAIVDIVKKYGCKAEKL